MARKTSRSEANNSGWKEVKEGSAVWGFPWPWRYPKIDVLQWKNHEKPVKRDDDWGYPYDSGNHHISKCDKKIASSMSKLLSLTTASSKPRQWWWWAETALPNSTSPAPASFSQFLQLPLASRYFAVTCISKWQTWRIFIQRVFSAFMFFSSCSSLSWLPSFSSSCSPYSSSSSSSCSSLLLLLLLLQFLCFFFLIGFSAVRGMVTFTWFSQRFDRRKLHSMRSWRMLCFQPLRGHSMCCDDGLKAEAGRRGGDEN